MVSYISGSIIYFIIILCQGFECYCYFFPPFSLINISLQPVKLVVLVFIDCCLKNRPKNSPSRLSVMTR